MRFDVITLFPELFAIPLTQGVTRRAFDEGQVQVRTWPLRDFADGPHRRVDDRPYGGGPGMVMLFEPLERALKAIRAERAEAQPVPLVHFTPDRRAHRPDASSTTSPPGRVRCCCAGATKASTSASSIGTSIVELSLGDFVLSGGELPALALLDAVARLQEGVLGDAESHRAGQLLRRPARGPSLQPTGSLAARKTPGPCPTSCCRATTPPSRAGAASARSSSRRGAAPT